MALRPGIRISLTGVLSFVLLGIATAQAARPQTPPEGSRKGVSVPLDRFRGNKSIVRGGRIPQRDSLAHDSLPDDPLHRNSPAQDSLPGDSLRRGADGAWLPPDGFSETGAQQDSLLLRLTGGDSLLRDILPPDSLRSDTLALVQKQDTALLDKHRGWFMNDSMSLSRVCWMSVPLPGYGQIYNKQYWKLPILYGTFGTSLALFLHENNKYKPLKRRYDELTDENMSRSEELETVQASMIRHNTRRQLYLLATVGSYIYFIGDAAVNYSTNDVSAVKKATTLATICPSAGQIYNRSYWKVPIVIGGFASMIYVIDWNNRGYQRFKKAYRLKADWDAADKDERPAQSPDEFKGRYTADFLKNLKNNYRRNRDLSIIATAGIYLLQIIDAHVDAHLKDFDVSDDLSMRVEPAFDYTYIAGTGTRPVVGFNFTINF